MSDHNDFQFGRCAFFRSINYEKSKKIPENLFSPHSVRRDVYLPNGQEEDEDANKGKWQQSPSADLGLKLFVLEQQLLVQRKQQGHVFRGYVRRSRAGESLQVLA